MIAAKSAFSFGSPSWFAVPSIRLLLLGLSLVGCGGSDDGASRVGPSTLGNGANSTEIRQFNDEVAASYCRITVECSAGKILERNKDIARCTIEKSREAESSVVWSLSNIEWHSVEAQACLAVLTKTGCPALAELHSALHTVCADAARGGANAGEPCSHDKSCHSGHRCDREAGACQGRCVRLPAEGEACPDKLCAAGLTCHQTICAVPTKAGAPCDSSLPGCGDMAVCNDPGTGRSICRLLDEGYHSIRKGEPCTIGPQCAEGLYCSDGSDGTCIPRLAAGESCTSGILKCIEGTQCIGATTGINSVAGKCVADIPLSGACSTDPFSAACGEGRCRGGICRYDAALGETCTEDSDCYSHACASDRCVLRSACPEG